MLSYGSFLSFSFTPRKLELLKYLILESFKYLVTLVYIYSLRLVLVLIGIRIVENIKNKVRLIL
jgi:hypothetical protein